MEGEHLLRAGALVGAGAASVVVLPIARVIGNPDCWGSHPYVAAMEKPYDVAASSRIALNLGHESSSTPAVIGGMKVEPPPSRAGHTIDRCTVRQSQR